MKIAKTSGNWSRYGLVWAGIVVLALGTACDPDIVQREMSGPRTQPVFDPATSTIPLPNDLAIQSDGTLPSLPGAGEANAQGVFFTWLSGLHGWLPETPIEIPFSGPLDASTISDETVRMYRMSGEGLASVASCELIYTENAETGTSRIILIP